MLPGSLGLGRVELITICLLFKVYFLGSILVGKLMTCILDSTLVCFLFSFGKFSFH